MESPQAPAVLPPLPEEDFGTIGAILVMAATEQAIGVEHLEVMVARLAGRGPIAAALQLSLDDARQAARVLAQLQKFVRAAAPFERAIRSALAAVAAAAQEDAA